MSVTMLVLAITAGTGLSVTALLTIVRIIAGPTLLDRMIASDVLLTTLMLALGLDMVLRGHTDSIALMTAIAATATLATIVVARYVRRQRVAPPAQAEGGSDV